jgi:hypothetical protein
MPSTRTARKDGRRRAAGRPAEARREGEGLRDSEERNPADIDECGPDRARARETSGGDERDADDGRDSGD